MASTLPPPPATFVHEPVLLERTLELLALRPGATVLDGTLGGAGHAEAILERTAPDGRLIGLDVDDQALAAARERLARFGERVQLVRMSFRSLDQALAQTGHESLDALLLDLGVSSPQLDRADRGFRFAIDTASETPLDMRMDQRGETTAADLLAQASEEQLVAWLREYGELRGAHRLGRALVERRRERPIATTQDLLDVIREARIGGGRRHNPATLVFQALRIAVNDELEALRDGLERGLEALHPGGRLAVIAYHSLEDRIVKHRLREGAKRCICPPSLPVCRCGERPELNLLTRRPVRPDDDEVSRNPRARSARLRAAERLDAPLRRGAESA